MYCSVQDVRNSYRMITPDVYSDRMVATAILFADSEIDLRLAQKCSVPFTTVPTIIRSVSIKLAVSELIDPTHAGDGLSKEAPFSVRLRKRALEILEGIASGKLSLEDAKGKQGIAVSNISNTTQYLAAYPNGYETPSNMELFDLYKVPTSTWPSS